MILELIDEIRALRVALADPGRTRHPRQRRRVPLSSNDRRRQYRSARPTADRGRSARTGHLRPALLLAAARVGPVGEPLDILALEFDAEVDASVLRGFQ